MDKYYATDMDGNVLSVDDIVIYGQNNRGIGRAKIIEITDNYFNLKLQISKNRYCNRHCSGVLLDKEGNFEI